METSWRNREPLRNRTKATGAAIRSNGMPARSLRKGLEKTKRRKGTSEFQTSGQSDSKDLRTVDRFQYCFNEKEVDEGWHCPKGLEKLRGGENGSTLREAVATRARHRSSHKGKKQDVATGRGEGNMPTEMNS